MDKPLRYNTENPTPKPQHPLLSRQSKVSLIHSLSSRDRARLSFDPHAFVDFEESSHLLKKILISYLACRGDLSPGDVDQSGGHEAGVGEGGGRLQDHTGRAHVQLELRRC